MPSKHRGREDRISCAVKTRKRQSNQLCGQNEEEEKIESAVLSNKEEKIETAVQSNKEEKIELAVQTNKEKPKEANQLSC